MSSKFGDFIAEKRKQKDISLRKMAELLISLRLIG